MSQPFSGMPDPGTPRPIRRRFQPGIAQEALQAGMRTAQDGLRHAQRYGRDLQRYGRDLWFRGKRNPRMFALIGGAVALTLGGAYALSASGAGRSLCPSAAEGRKAPFVLLMDQVPHPMVRSEVEIHYDVCGLPSGTPYRGEVRLAPVQAGKKKKSAKPKPLIVPSKDKADGVATRRHQELALGSTKPGAYTLELSVVDSQGRE